ncbi:MAG: hypothetical protein GDA43_10480 [Hormoscilla sp. SP5CHS1]|nr:hypothetical protein [Hormoscilla sp. SP12CHS1]MBC6453580.1 hypothetical protein [Hormoscilla sp. SP5CHS1]
MSVISFYLLTPKLSAAETWHQAIVTNIVDGDTIELPLGTAAQIRDPGSSSYKGIVAEVFRENRSVNLLMVREVKPLFTVNILTSVKLQNPHI